MWRSRHLSVALTLTARGLAREGILDRIAALVAECPPGEGVLLEGTLDGAPLALIPSGVRATESLCALADDAEGALVVGRPGLAPTPGRGCPEERWGALIGADTIEGVTDDDRRPSWDPDGADDLPRLGDLGNPSVWIAVQSHWVALPARRLAASTRYRLATVPGRADAEAVRAGALITSLVGSGERVVWAAPSRRRWRRWVDGRPTPAPRASWGVVSPAEARRLVAQAIEPRFPSPEELDRHLVLLGASGSGKTTLLVRLAADAVRRGEATIVFDLHGDLGPALLAVLDRATRHRVHVLDPTVGDGHGPGIAVLAGGGTDDRTSAHVVAALKRLTPDGGEVYWGFRIERVVETFVRAVQEEEGTLLDVYDLLTDADRREATRLSTRQPAVARFFAELPALLRRNPEFLGPATARLARLALSSRLASLLAPSGDSTVPFSELVDRGATLVVRLPLAEIGPEAAGFAATLLLTRLYLDLAARPRRGAVRVILDEAQAISPPLVAEILGEGRKFGLRAAVATQYPDRFAPEVRRAAAGAAGTHVVFRLPAPAARAGAEWVGLSVGAAATILPRLTDGWGVVAGGSRAAPRLVHRPPLPPPISPLDWAEAVEATRAAFGRGAGLAAVGLGGEDERLLLHLLGEGRPVGTERLLRAVAGSFGAAPAVLLERVGGLERAGLIQVADGTVVLTAAGARRLGAGAEHGSSREGIEHRQLLLEAFRIFASHGERIELLRQGRFDTRLPDGRLRLLPPDVATFPPRALARWLAQRERSWAWRHFDGRDVYLEAEVSGAERAERIRHDWRKAERAGAAVVFLVGDARRARRVRATLERLGADPRRARVWTLASVGARQHLDP